MIFFIHTYVHHRDLHSFPTRRSSDLEPNQSFVLNGNAPVAGDFVGKYRMIGKGAGGVSFNVSINGVSFPPANMSSGDFSVRYENHLLTGISGSSFTFKDRKSVV